MSYRSEKGATGSWSNGLFDCYSDMTICMLSFILPCYVFGLVAENTGKNCLGYSVLSLIPFANWYFCTKVRTDLLCIRITYYNNTKSSNLPQLCRNHSTCMAGPSIGVLSHLSRPPSVNHYDSHLQSPMHTAHQD